MTSFSGFETRLVTALQPVRHGFTAAVLYTFLETGLAASLAKGPATAVALADGHRMAASRLEGLLLFLCNEGYLTRHEDVFSLTPKGAAVVEFEPWYTLLVGGYATTLTQLGQTLAADSPYATRNGAEVGRGSCGISRYDAIPLVLTLLERIEPLPHRLIDIGCGDGSFLLDLLERLPGTRGVCVDPDRDSVQAARRSARRRGLADRCDFVVATAGEFAEKSGLFPGRPGDCYLASFALQEALEQDGEQALIDTVRALFGRAPDAHLVVVEVEQRAADHDVMRDGLALAYYNPYFLLHRITAQRLESRDYWDELFEKAGLRRLAVATVDAAVDSTGFEFGYLLAAA
jgi:2-ketoarginine methyltransferase